MVCKLEAGLQQTAGGEAMSDKPTKRVRVGGGDRKRPRVARFFDWRKSDPNKYAGLNGFAEELVTYKNNLIELIQ
jgi:hypothetical protein